MGGSGWSYKKLRVTKAIYIYTTFCVFYHFLITYCWVSLLSSGSDIGGGEAWHDGM